MTATVLFLTFVVMLLGAVPIAVALGLAGTIAIIMAGGTPLAVATNVYTGIAKYPLIAIPMFVLVGSVFDRTGVALRLVRFATALVGAGRGALATVSVLVAMVIGGISGSGPATSAAVGQVVTGSMIKDGYPRPFIASTVAAAAATDILIPPSIAFIIYALLVPSVSVPAIFAAGMFPGILAGLAIIVPILLISWLNDFGGKARASDGTERLADLQGGVLGAACSRGHPGRHAHRCLHADGSSRDGGLLRPVHRHLHLSFAHAS